MRAPLFLLVEALAACTRCAPVNPPPVDPGPPVVLSHAIFDCTEAWVEAERPNVARAIEVCLAGDYGYTGPCLLAVATQRAHADTVGCEARDRGARASASVALGHATPVEQTIAQNARRWIREEEVSFR